MMDPHAQSVASAGTRALTELAAARQRLLDLTMRNPLLNYRPRKTRSIRVVDEHPRELYDRLVLREQDLVFAPRTGEAGQSAESPRPDDHAAPEGPAALPDAQDPTADDRALLWRPPVPHAAPEPRHTDRFLQTELPAEELQRRLFYVRQQARTVLREQGYTVHYLALGFVTWIDPHDPADPRHAPLILVPVELQRTRVKASFKLVWSGEDVLTNISLQEKLGEWQVAIPEFSMPADKAGIDAYFAAVSGAIDGQPGWQVTSEVALDFFSFTKFVMYKDLDPAAWPDGHSPTDHPLVRQVLDPRPDAPAPADLSVDDLDERVDPAALFHVMDADPSQMGVIEAVKAGRDLVVEGPPGTGKSQTITNLIAELLAAGRSVLFVSEKMAALEVVKDRLDRVGIGDYCLELHSRKTRKKDVLQELERTLNLRAPRTVDTADEFSRLTELTRELNTYVADLRTPCGPLGRSPYALLNDIERCAALLAAADRPRLPVDLPDATQCTSAACTAAAGHVQDLADALALVAPVKQHAWYGTHPHTTLPADEDAVITALQALRSALEGVNRRAAALVEVTAMRRPDTPAALGASIAAAELLSAAPPTSYAVLTHADWDDPATRVAPVIAALADHGRLRQELAELFVDEALEREIKPLLDEYKRESARLLRLFSSRYRYLKRDISMLYRGTAPSAIERRIADLRRLTDLDRAAGAVRAHGVSGRALFGDLWQDERGDPERLRSFAAWIAAVRRAMHERILTADTLRGVDGSLDRAAIDDHRRALAEATTPFIAQYEALTTRLHVDARRIFGCPADDVPFDRLASWLDRLLGARDHMQRWSRFATRLDHCRASIARDLAERVLAHDDVAASDLLPAFEAAVAEQGLRCALAERPALAEFVGELHDRKRSRFARLDRELIQANRQRLARLLYDRRPRVQSGAPAGSEAGIIQGEFNRKRGHMPIRRLLSRAGRLIQRIKPCFMMSPLSIAQYLDPQTARFDVVIFDEASQVRPEDAVGALLRGTQLVVMGDTRQLPPTSFFDHLGEADELDDESTSVAEVESILHQCKRSFQTQSLRWHYRSRHQSLITVSNEQFYEGRLHIYPSPVDHDDYLGLCFNHLPGTVYDRGGTGVNRDEARAVVAAAMDLFRRYPNKSLGVAAFNIRQQQAILEEVELQLKHHPELEHHFVEDRLDEFFVKNLETIQGDERDIILISVGFGFDGDGKLSHNFGPLNQEGGERRLNVLITRARERCEVFSNFTAQDLRVGADSPFGLRALHAFLDYARRRHDRVAPTADQDRPSHIERSIMACIEDLGYDVRPQIGCASYRVDIGVVDPRDDGRFLMGIECDGPRYHDAPVARDRERLRDQVMAGLGWELHRVWSLDWYRQRRHEADRLGARLEAVHQHSAGNRPASAGPSGPTIQYEQEAGDPVDDDPDIPLYVTCPRPRDWDATRELYDLDVMEIGHMVATIVEAEGPVHTEEVIRRLRGWWDLSRAGARIREAVENGMTEAMGRGRVRRDERDFLWPRPERPPVVRRRDGDPPARLELVCDEEIVAAIEQVLTLHHAALPAALARQVAHNLGIRAVTAAISERIQALVRAAVEDGRLEQLPNGMVDLDQRGGSR